MRSSRKSAGFTRRGFTLVELMTVGALLSLLLLLISAAWTGFGRPSTIAISRARIAQEASLAVESLARDLGGSLADEPTGTRESAQLVGRSQPGGDQLRLCFDGAPLNGIADWTLPDTRILYRVQDGQLLRQNETTGQEIVVASNVTEMATSDVGSGVLIELTFTVRDITRTYTIEARDP